MKASEKLIITISRQLGAGGAYIGQQIARKLKIHYADHEIIRKAAEKLSVKEEDIERRDEKTQPFWETMLFSSGYAPEFYVPINIKYAPTDAEMYNVEMSIMQKLAENIDAVIIGRGGFHIFKDRPNTLKVFLFAPKEYRIDRVMTEHNLNEAEAKKAIEDSDRERAKYIDAFTGLKWIESTNFDLTLNTSKLGLDKTAEAILAMINLMK
ncbi:MAG: AAA family ATPase [Bacteroidales bacterium]|nr:cytidylate kinase-like family protein [Bacteroidales bacterium]HPE99995.1 cytidylate kinase-like family protein [Bacteroidales bacterium]